ncbi:MAG: type III pantothenate kinase [Nitrospinaceae bacterium]|jgi:type III pantothenate kinase|nr:type III pantothenate kinase [Nitrospinaceae bacterium]MBT3434581.1 type III pantothenate kinase [Nitrospinaceae bacterium]MBT3822822.1 type III pantothenate kinase [Nitrospinaceae bacterium]MBT4094648.1 type III pantothenate kinase [Nitrospinaceae bacterium]MBT4431655.1 type III pantothenate kinase [Nitrospinaceae bacterium]
MSVHLLAIDVGNTETVIGLFEGEEKRASWRLGSVARRTADELAVIIEGLFRLSGFEMSSVSRVVISSVVPPLGPTLEVMSTNHFGVTPLLVGPGTRTGISIKYDNPHEVGADRIVNAVAGFHLHGGPLIIADFGTAITFDAISVGGEYLGGAISPGFGVSLEALVERAARLPRIEPAAPTSVIGKNTVHSIQSGMFFGYKGLINGIVERMKLELGGDTKVVATGGQSLLFSEDENIFDHIDPDLTLIGLRLIAERNP